LTDPRRLAQTAILLQEHARFESRQENKTILAEDFRVVTSVIQDKWTQSWLDVATDHREFLPCHFKFIINPLNAELNPICNLLALLGGATIVVVSRLRVNGTAWRGKTWERHEHGMQFVNRSLLLSSGNQRLERYLTARHGAEQHGNGMGTACNV